MTAKELKRAATKEKKHIYYKSNYRSEKKTPEQKFQAREKYRAYYAKTGIMDRSILGE